MDLSILASLFSHATWGYTHNGESINETDIRELINELETSTFTEEDIKAQISCLDDIDVAAFYNQSNTKDINIYVGWLIADRLAQTILLCPYETVTFYVSF